MATTKKTATKKAYEVKGKTTSIKAVSRCAIKIGDCYYTVEAEETREFEDVPGMKLDLEWKSIFESVNNIVDAQAEEISEMNK